MRRVSDPAATLALRSRGSSDVSETYRLDAPGVSRSQCELTYGPGEPALLAVGEVGMVEEEMNPDVIS